MELRSRMSRNREEATRLKWEYIRPLFGDRTARVGVLVFASIGSAFTETGILAIAAQVATRLASSNRVGDVAFGPIRLHATLGQLLEVALVLAVVRLLLQLATAYLPGLIAGDVQANFRRRLVGAYVRSSWETQSQGREGHFQEMMSRQVGQASTGATSTMNLIVLSANVLILVASAVAINPVASLATMAAAVALFVFLRPINMASSRAARALGRAQLGFAGAVQEVNRMSEEAHVYGVVDEQRAHVDTFINETRDLSIRTQALGRLGPNLYQSSIYLGLVVGLIVLSGAVTTGLASIGAVVLLLVRAGGYGTLTQAQYQSLLQAIPYIERLNLEMAVYRQSDSVHGDRPLSGIEELAFDDVHYAYPGGRPILDGVTFSIKGRETIGVIGPTGAGKSTIVQVLLRLRPPGAGRYLVNGETADVYEGESWHSQFSYLPQQPKLIHASVADNVRFHREASDAEVERACRLAHIHDEIVSWPEGYQTVIGPRASAISGGQQQRICLARALVSHPSVLVLDEPTSALDPHSEALIQESLLSLREDLTLIVVAHRMSTLAICDRVMVVLNGVVDAFGTPQALQSDNAYYRHAMSLGVPQASLEPR